MRLKTITFVTTNEGKVLEAQKCFDENKIKLVSYNLELNEPRTDDIQEIAKAKVLQAYEKVGQPCIALDAGFFIEELNGFPRAFVHFALDTIGIEGILKLMEGKENRKCFFEQCLAYYDGKEIKYFFCKNKGSISERIEGSENKKKWSDLWYIYIPEEANKTLASFSDAEIERRQSGSKSTIAQFAEWFSKEIEEN
jgi:XTP/dITP diphosphohydrolase